MNFNWRTLYSIRRITALLGVQPAVSGILMQ